MQNSIIRHISDSNKIFIHHRYAKQDNWASTAFQSNS